MRWRVGVADVAAAVVVAVVILLPPREASVQNAYYDHINKRAAPAESLAAISALQAELAENPKNAEAADKLSEILAGFGQTDDALRVAGQTADATAPDNWRSLLSVAAVHADRIEFETARAWTDKARDACKADGSSCRADSAARIRIFADELDRAIKAVADGHNPRTDPQGFREAVGERRLPPVRVN